MRFLTNLDRSFEAPQVMVQLLLGVNSAIFLLCIFQSKETSIPPELLFRYGAMYSAAIERGEYWRLIAAGFLHANPLHIFGNMLCLVLWGGLLEKRLGAFYFTCIYVSGLVGGAIVSDITHAGPYLSVGASGAISAVLGALLSLRLLGRLGLPWSFFVINIGLNIALAASVTRIDWGAHLGGFAAGMAACVCLDILERMFALVLRCKFPEFVKMNGFIVFVIVAAYCWKNSVLPLSQQNIWVLALGVVVISLAAVKVTDLILSMKKGLAVVVVAFALANAALVLLWNGALAQALASLCAGRSSVPDSIIVAMASACTNVERSIVVAAVSVFALTMLLYWRQFVRGISDVGFVGGALRGERTRHRGL
jgi:membrane associated rhomboid family serine protease